ncbi:MAG: tyrosine-type recombinase/integrase [Isosphaeraceae bacterium]
MASVFKPSGSRKYVIMWRDENGKRRKKSGATDKQVTERIARNIENRVALRREGVVDPKAEAYRDHEARPLAEHLAAYAALLADKGRTKEHIALTISRARRVVALFRGAPLADIQPANSSADELARAAARLADWIAPARLSDLTGERVQAALATLREGGRSLATCNHHATAVCGFAKWCHKTHRLREHPLRGVERFNAKEDRRHDRRTISLDELQRLIEAAERGPRHVRMTGPMRALCYRLAVATGLRFSEIASIRPESFDWKAPSVTVAAGYTKNGEPAILPLPRDLADDLAAYGATLPPGMPVFPMPRRGRGAEMLRIDLAAAGIPYRDAAGLVFDFHALRCETATLADQAGISPRVVQRMMRHSTLELTGRYTRPRALDIEAAASLLPSLKPAPLPSESVALTGTDPTPVPDLTATRFATPGEGSERNPIACNIVASNGERTQNPVG